MDMLERGAPPPVALALLLALAATAAATQEHFAFAFSADPEQPLVAFTFGGEYYGPPEEETLTLYADGSLDKRRGEERFAAHLSYAEMESLLTLLARGGVLDTTSDALEEKIAQRTGGYKPAEFVQDGGSTTITVTLDRYRNGNVVREPFETSVTCVGVSTVYSLYPDLAEPAAIVEAYLLLFKHPGLRTVEDGP